MNKQKTTLQELFDRICEHLLTQNRKAIEVTRQGEMCRYRGADGCSCAIGCLIPDDDYDPSIEGSIVLDAPVWSRIPYELDEHLLVSLRNLQNLHDAWRPSDWPCQLRAFARYYQLTCEVIDRFAKVVEA
jgi:hypothetical protein